MRVTFLVTTFFLFLSIKCFSQDNFTIKGKIDLRSKSENVIIMSSWGSFHGSIDNNGNFEIKGRVKEAGTALIKTDSSGADAIWLQPGEYKIRCREIEGINFRIPELNGPKDAEIYHGFLEKQYYIKGELSVKQFFSAYIDSIFQTYPSSEVLPEMLRMAGSALDDKKVSVYLGMLNKDQIQAEGTNSLKNYYKRKEKIETEKIFQNFQMKDNHGNIFELSSLNKKLILLDFWASWCMPCRRKHPKLAELYKKFADKGFEIVSISLDDNEIEWKKAIVKDSLTWINVSELKGWETSLSESYFINTIPFAFWLDKDMKIIGNELSEKEIEKILD